MRAAPRAVIHVVTDPPDPLADTARTRAGHDRVPSTGTFLDSLGFRFHLAEHFDVAANQVEAQVIGQHGVSQVFLWSVARIAGVPIGKLIEARGKSLEGTRKKMEDSVRDANITIIKAMTLASLASDHRDERAVVPIGSFNENFGVTLSLPSVVGRGGIIRSFVPEMSGEERQDSRRAPST